MKIQNSHETEERGTAPVSYAIEDAPAVCGLSRTRLYGAIKKKELTARKHGRSTIIEADELRRFVRSLPTIGRGATAA